MQTTKTLVRKFILNIYGLEYDLPYQILTYIKTDNDNYENLKNNNIKTKWFFDKNKKRHLYYLDSEYIYPIEERLDNIEAIFDAVNPDKNKTLLEEIIENKEFNTKKTKSTSLFDPNSSLLSVLASYLIVLSEKESYTLSENAIKIIHKYEVASFNDELMSNVDDDENEDDIIYNRKNKHNWHINKSTEEHMNKFKDKYKTMIDRWENSSNHKHNLLYSNWNNNKPLIDVSLPYKAEWCYIDSDNCFIFSDVYYNIKNLEKDDNMDHILVLEQRGNRYYFDMNINQINNNDIKIKT